MGGCALLLRYLFALNPKITETIYSRGIFKGIRLGFDYTLGLLPFPIIYLLVALLVLFDIIKILQWLRARKNESQKKVSFKVLLLKGFFFVLAAAGAVVFFFYILWAYNYERIPIAVHLKIKPEPLGLREIRAEAALALQMMVQAREKIPQVGPSIKDLKKTPQKEALEERFIPNNLETKVRESLEGVLKSMNYPTTGRVRVKKLRPGGLLMSLGSSGFYFPFTGEAYIAANLTPVEIPFLIAHEMAHGYGFAQEDTAGFLAYLACISSKDPFIEYSGCQAYFSHIAMELYNATPQEYHQLEKELPPGIIADRRKKYENWQKYRGWLMNWSEKVYDSYLKTQGVDEGIKSYNGLVLLITAWRKGKAPDSAPILPSTH